MSFFPSSLTFATPATLTASAPPQQGPEEKFEDRLLLAVQESNLDLLNSLIGEKQLAGHVLGITYETIVSAIEIAANNKDAKILDWLFNKMHEALRDHYVKYALFKLLHTDKLESAKFLRQCFEEILSDLKYITDKTFSEEREKLIGKRDFPTIKFLMEILMPEEKIILLNFTLPFIVEVGQFNELFNFVRSIEIPHIKCIKDETVEDRIYNIIIEHAAEINALSVIQILENENRFAKFDYETALLTAAQNGNWEIFEILLKNTNPLSELANDLAIHRAVSGERSDILKMLLLHGIPHEINFTVNDEFAALKNLSLEYEQSERTYRQGFEAEQLGSWKQFKQFVGEGWTFTEEDEDVYRFGRQEIKVGGPVKATCRDLRKILQTKNKIERFIQLALDNAVKTDNLKLFKALLDASLETIPKIVAHALPLAEKEGSIDILMYMNEIKTTEGDLCKSKNLNEVLKQLVLNKESIDSTKIESFILNQLKLGHYQTVLNLIKKVQFSSQFRLSLVSNISEALSTLSRPPSFGFDKEVMIETKQSQLKQSLWLLGEE